MDPLASPSTLHKLSKELRVEVFFSSSTISGQRYFRLLIASIARQHRVH